MGTVLVFFGIGRPEETYTLLHADSSCISSGNLGISQLEFPEPEFHRVTLPFLLRLATEEFSFC